MLIAAMVSTRAKVKRERAGTSRQEVVSPTSPESKDTIDWEALCNEDDDKVERTVTENKQPLEPESTIRKYTRRRSSRYSEVRINEPLASTQSRQRESPWIEGRFAPSMPSQPFELVKLFI